MKPNSIAILFLVILSCCKVKQAPLKITAVKTTDFNKISQQFIAYAKNGKDTKEIQERLANTSLKELSSALKTDEQKYAFWINIYNAYILVILKDHPEYYKDKKEFFSKEQLKIAGQTIAFSKIEHGIIRKSQWELGLGYFRTWFPDKFERELRVQNRDYRIHFALNCGAKDCPPVAIYTPKKIKEQLEKATKIYLKRTSNHNTSKNKITVTPLFSWFKGDFGGKNGIKKILKEQGIIKDTKGVDLVFKNYDWTLDLDNFIDL